MMIRGSDIDSTLYNGFEFNTSVYPAVDFSLGRHANSFVLVGPSGGGKEARGDALSSLLSIKGKFSSGDIFRHLQSSNFPEKADIKLIVSNSNELGGELDRIAQSPELILEFYKGIGLVTPRENEAIAVFQALNGYFVEDSLYLDFARSQSLHSNVGSNSPAIYDGHIRRGSQVKTMIEISGETHRPIDAALFVHTDMSLLEKRLVGRLHCSAHGCKLKYNLTASTDSDMYPHNVFIGEDGLEIGYCKSHKDTMLTRRGDDFPQKVRRRLDQYRDNVHGICEAFRENGVSLFIVNGDLNPYSSPLVRASVLDSLRCDNERVLSLFHQKKE
jgi:adenylate kinase family enzyme